MRPIPPIAGSRNSASGCDKTQSLRADFARAVTRLDEALARPKDPIVRDSAIQRFEISFELCWKFLKAYLEEQHNAVCTSPRTCFRSAFRHGVIDNDPFWINRPADQPKQLPLFDVPQAARRRISQSSARSDEQFQMDSGRRPSDILRVIPR